MPADTSPVPPWPVRAARPQVVRASPAGGSPPQRSRQEDEKEQQEDAQGCGLEWRGKDGDRGIREGERMERLFWQVVYIHVGARKRCDCHKHCGAHKLCDVQEITGAFTGTVVLINTTVL